MTDSPYIVDVTAADFGDVVIEGSKERTVLVDFWADWCGPCRALAPILAKIVNEGEGKFLLAKVDTDAERTLAENSEIRSLPTVQIYIDGQIVDQFMGAQPESAIRALLERHATRPSDAVREQASVVARQGQTARAVELLRGALADEPDNTKIHPELAALLLTQGAAEEAEDTLKQLPPNAQQSEPVRQLYARIAFARIVNGAPGKTELEDIVAADPGNCRARHQLGARKLLSEDYEGAMDQFLEIIRNDRTFEDDAGKKSLLAAFEILGSSDPRVPRYRSALSSLLL